MHLSRLLNIILILSTTKSKYTKFLFQNKNIRVNGFKSVRNINFLQSRKQVCYSQGKFLSSRTFWVESGTFSIIKEIFLDQGNFPHPRKFSTQKFDQENFLQSRKFSIKKFIKKSFHKIFDQGNFSQWRKISTKNLIN